MQKYKTRLTKVEKAVRELAEAQKKTEEEVRNLAIGPGNLTGEVGGLSRTLVIPLKMKPTEDFLNF